jgi:tight adherence protein B
MLIGIAGLVFLATVTMIVGIWWAAQARSQMRRRLAGVATAPSAGVDDLLRLDEDSSGLGTVLTRTGAFAPLSLLVRQAGSRQSATDIALIISALAAAGLGLGWMRTKSPLFAVAAGLIAAALPIAYLLYKRHKRLRAFEKQFPDALDMISRAIRAGNALSGAIRLVGEEMPDPVGEEFQIVSEEIRLGVDPSEALSRLRERAPVQDAAFFSTAIRIQRGSGGNLAEILDRLAEVIRERFKILSYARVLSAQHRWSAILVGLSPVFFAVLFELTRPGYFDAMRADPLGPWLVGLGLVLEAIGFFLIWRIAKIKV